MYIGVKELERHQLTFREDFAPGLLDFRTQEFRQAGPMHVEASAALEDDEIHIVGKLRGRLELFCVRCLRPVERIVERRFDLYYRSVSSIRRDEEIQLDDDDLDVGFYTGDGLFLADVVVEQVLLALPMKALCSEECRGICPGCGANLTTERCQCGPRGLDPRLAPLAQWLERHNAPAPKKKS